MNWPAWGVAVGGFYLLFFLIMKWEPRRARLFPEKACRWCGSKRFAMGDASDDHRWCVVCGTVQRGRSK